MALSVRDAFSLDPTSPLFPALPHAPAHNPKLPARHSGTAVQQNPSMRNTPVKREGVYGDGKTTPPSSELIPMY
jgi:hypothetical protein